MTFVATDIVIIAGSYGAGCFTVGYYVFRWRTGGDIRDHGSGNPGARNVGRVLGRRWFVVTLLLDGVKGALAVGAARHFGLSDVGVIAAMLATVSGHIWPLQLGFRGGKGVAVSLGAGVVYAPTVAALVLPVFGVFLGLFRSVTLAGLLAFMLAPGAAALSSHGASTTMGMAGLAALVSFAHRHDIRKKIDRRRTEAKGWPGERG